MLKTKNSQIQFSIPVLLYLYWAAVCGCGGQFSNTIQISEAPKTRDYGKGIPLSASFYMEPRLKSVVARSGNALNEEYPPFAIGDAVYKYAIAYLSSAFKSFRELDVPNRGNEDILIRISNIDCSYKYHDSDHDIVIYDISIVLTIEGEAQNKEVYNIIVEKTERGEYERRGPIEVIEKSDSKKLLQTYKTHLSFNLFQAGDDIFSKGSLEKKFYYPVKSHLSSFFVTVVDHSRRLCHSDCSDPKEIFKKALQLFGAKDYRAAQAEFEHLIATDPSNPWARSGKKQMICIYCILGECLNATLYWLLISSAKPPSYIHEFMM